MNNSRTELFGEALKELAAKHAEISIVKPVPAKEDELLLFHSAEYVSFVKESSMAGAGFLDYGDTPSFPGVFEASLFPVGNTLNGFRLIMDGKFDHFFNPVGGLHHAQRERAGGFCVFNDAAIAISRSLESGLSKVAYVDIDAHHGDGVFYGFESDPRVVIADIHEDGRYLYPGTGSESETVRASAKDTKLNLPLMPGSGDLEFIKAFDRAEEFIRRSKPEFIFFQCGADGHAGDPISHLRYSHKAHSHAASKLHDLAHKVCNGRILAMGGGGYDPANVRDAWISVARALAGSNSSQTSALERKR